MVEAQILPLRLSGASVRRGGRLIVGPIDYKVTPKGFTIVLGPNGAGKTTLLRMMHGLERPSSGTLKWQASEEIARKAQAFVSQTPIMMRRSVLENVAFPLAIRGVSKRQARAEALKWLERIELFAEFDLEASELSGGERQKLSLARALIVKPQILFVDEPCANLDGSSTRAIEQILLQSYAEGIRIVMSTHDLGQARRLANDVVFLYRGAIHEAADVEQFFGAPQKPETEAFLRGDILE